jgi:hypothetical protein
MIRDKSFRYALQLALGVCLGLDQGIGHLAFLRLQKNKRLNPNRG